MPPDCCSSFGGFPFACGLCMQMTRTSFTKIHTIPVPALRPCLTRAAFSFTLVRSFVAASFITLASELVRKLVYSAAASLPTRPADAGLQWEPCDKILAALFRRVSTLVVGMQLSRYNRGRIKLLTLLIIYSRLNFENILLLVA